MYRVKTFNKISPIGLNRLDPELYTVSDSETEEDAILVRSAKLLDYDFPKNLLAIARAGAGVNNIPLDRCSEAGSVVFNTPGANANAVKELVLCAMLMGSRDVDGGIQWVRNLRCPYCGRGYAMPWWRKGEKHFCDRCGREIVFDDPEDPTEKRKGE